MSLRRCLTIALFVLTAACRTQSPPPEQKAPPPERRGPRALGDVTYERTAARRERGQYLTEGVLQCFACHSDRDWTRPGGPPKAGRKGAGHVWEDRPWLVSPNLTPDKETGAGTWTDDMFARAIREGVGHDGRVLHPQMWYGSFRSLSDEDLASVIVYLRSLPAVRNPLPVTKLPPGRKPLVAPEPLDGPVPAPDLATPVARGAYLARVADCQGCHTAWEAPLVPGLFGGGNKIEAYGRPAVFSANLTSAPSGIGAYYDETLFREVLRTGHLKGRAISGLMPWIVFGNMTDADLDAVFAYLKSMRPVNHAVSNTDDPSACPMCGQTHGLGDRNKPKLARAIPLDPRTIGDYTGTFRYKDGATAVISTDGTILRVQFDGKGKIHPLGQIEAGAFAAAEFPEIIVFRRDAKGRVVEFLDDVNLATRIK